jgi:hypothetical protein
MTSVNGPAASHERRVKRLEQLAIARPRLSRREREGVKKVEERLQSLIVKYTKFSHCRRRRSSVAC